MKQHKIFQTVCPIVPYYGKMVLIYLYAGRSMNHTYRLIFNKATGAWTAVCEYAKKGGGKGGVRSMAAGLLLSVLCSIANANTQTVVIADFDASKGQQPMVLPTASGLVQVNIQTPNDQGLSNNHYSHFDVGEKGVILNNSRKPINTALAGFVDGNPYLARGEAKIILNQVNSVHPSRLHGFAEVAGVRADVIIANPQGIQVDGGGFINAQRVTLGGATATLDGQGYRFDPAKVTGHISIGTKGLDVTSSDYATLIGYATQVNGKLVAQGDLTVQNRAVLDVGNLGDVCPKNLSCR